MKKLFFVLFILIIIIGVSFAVFLYLPKLSTASNTKLSFVKPPSIKNETGVTNVLIVGVDTRDTKYLNTGTLTDTIIVASIDKNNNKIKLLSLPRDTWVEYDSRGSKINEVYTVKDLDTLISVVQGLLGVNIHYYAKVDFNTAVDFIDTLGGIEVNNPAAFTDYKYPKFGWENETCGIDVQALEKEKAENDELVTDGDFPCRFETISFEEGLITLDGQTALKYSRSRHSLDNNQGTDFARARRQHLVIEGVRKKLISSDIITDVGKLKELYGVFGEAIETDVTANDFILGFGYFGDVRNYSIESAVLSDNSDTPGGVLVRGNPDLYGGLYVLVPITEDSIKSFVNDFFYGEGM